MAGCASAGWLLFVLVAAVGSSPARRSRSTEAQEPWQINQLLCPPALCTGPDGVALEPSAGNACPPVLCGNRPLLLAAAPPGAAAEPSAHSRSGGGMFPFFEGDIVLNVDERRKQIDKIRSRGRSRSRNRSRRDIIRPVTKLWKFGMVPYIIDPGVDSITRASIDRAIRTFERRTCLIFRNKTDEDQDFLTFIYQPGCWSYVGKEGGGQYVSLGPGCDSYGTVLHEMSHAVGFWHEQSRPDRNKYVEVVEENIPSVYLEQFGQRDTNESSTRGYAYDYMSIMHYGRKYFSSNDRPTLRVIGIGKKLKMKIGQREKLSDIDVAQLRAMYYCNQKDHRDKVCRHGWQNYDNHCYKFAHQSMRTFQDARRACGNEGGYLLNINSQAENDFVVDYLQKFYGDVNTWRTGGKTNSNGRFCWLGSNGCTPMNYTNWARGQPGRYVTHILSRTRGNNPTFVWKATWAGNPKDTSNPPRFAYNFICESEPRVPCFNSSTGDGRDYRGTRDYTEGGVSCQSWNNQYPQQHKFYTGRRAVDNANGIGEHNYCRNPQGRRARPWCFTPFQTGSNRPRWQYCHIEIC